MSTRLHINPRDKVHEDHDKTDHYSLQLPYMAAQGPNPCGFVVGLEAHGKTEGALSSFIIKGSLPDLTKGQTNDITYLHGDP